VATCSSCGAEIVWCKTPTGKSIPVDPKPETRLVRTFGSPKFPLADGEHVSTAQTWVSHFATCPNAAQHRRPR
jgi:hypothetical protein